LTRSERGEPACALSRDQRLESGVHDGGFFTEPRQALGLAEESVVQDERCSQHGRSSRTRCNLDRGVGNAGVLPAQDLVHGERTGELSLLDVRDDDVVPHTAGLEA